MFDSKMLTSFAIKSSLSKYSNMKIGGNATYLLAPQSVSDLSSIVKEAKTQNLEIVPVGGGSNILFGNVGNRVIILDAYLPKIFQVDKKVVTVSSNIKISSFIDKTMQHGLGGLEFISGIPAHIGGAIHMNAGAFEKCIFDYLLWVEYVNLKGEIIKIDYNDLEFGYRTTSLQDFIVRAAFKLDKKTKKQISADREDIISKRFKRHPYDYPSLGSTFKNPVGMFAGQLIEECGLKGLQIGDAQISEKHANFIINRGNASFSDVTKLIQIVQETVTKQKGIELELEIKVIN
ncbi:MAG: UDP-N-acetylmuramate dehydrogenase [Candidatus Tenebribacter burtonii]|nr:UDP-N-acetylmuramate dehydrogenase [Candidatus Tenebribacter burtonii]